MAPVKASRRDWYCRAGRCRLQVPTGVLGNAARPVVDSAESGGTIRGELLAREVRGMGVVRLPSRVVPLSSGCCLTGWRRTVSTDRWAGCQVPQVALRLGLFVALSGAVCPASLRAQSMHASAGVYPQRLQPGGEFQLTVHVLDWGADAGGTAHAPATIAWPDWHRLGLLPRRSPSVSVRSTTVAGRPATATSATAVLQAKTEGTVHVPPISAKSTTGTVMTAALDVVIEKQAPSPAPSASRPPTGSGSLSPNPPGVQPAPGWPQLPGARSSPAGPAPVKPTGTPPREDATGNFQMAVGAVAFYLLVAGLALAAWRSRRKPTPRP